MAQLYTHALYSCIALQVRGDRECMLYRAVTRRYKKMGCDVYDVIVKT